jgi:hypothetical protein
MKRSLIYSCFLFLICASSYAQLVSNSRSGLAGLVAVLGGLFGVYLFLSAGRDLQKLSNLANGSAGWLFAENMK